MRFFLSFFLGLTVIALPGRAEVVVHFDTEQNRWTISNGWVQAKFHLTAAGTFEFEDFSSLGGHYGWRAPDDSPSSPIRFKIDNSLVGAQTSFLLQGQNGEAIERGGFRQTIVLGVPSGRFEVSIDLEMYAGQPVLRHSVRVKNLSARRVIVKSADMLPYSFADENATYRLFRVNQWTVAPREQNFETLQNTLDSKGTAVYVRSGARGLQCAWWALRDQANRGLFAGWEFDGRTDATLRHVGANGSLQSAANVLELNHPVEPGDEFRVPSAFIGLFRGDWDEAGYRTQRFTEASLAKPAPDPNFPYVVWDSWGFQDKLDEDTLKRNAEIAAKLGIELFVVDLGWARAIGDWHDDPVKFPSGLRSLSDYVHRLGMKFGLHFALSEAAPDSQVLQRHPEWTSSENYGYYGANSLCLSNRPAKEWLIGEAIRMIDAYNVDWILQDGENMVKRCTKTTHTHDPRDSNYSNSVDGLDAVLREIQRRRPNTSWENCEDGGNMMTFNMVRNYVTSITNDASGSLGSRQAVYGATYVFPPRYADRYMGDEELSDYVTRSFIFGGPWVFMTRLTEMAVEDLEFAALEIELFKAIRGKVREGKVFRLTARPATGRIDAIQTYHEPTNTGVAVVTRDEAADDHIVLKLRGLNASSTYGVRFQSDSRRLVMTGAQLMRDGVLVNLPEKKAAEVLFAEPL